MFYIFYIYKKPSRKVLNCGKRSFSSDTENNHNVQFRSAPVNSLQLQLNSKPKPNETNCPYIPFHHECSRCFKKRPLDS